VFSLEEVWGSCVCSRRRAGDYCVQQKDSGGVVCALEGECWELSV
jgi:hypothetical protein